MGQTGIGVMLGWSDGDERSVETLRNAVGKTIRAVWLGDDDALHMRFDDDSAMKLSDEGQSCCEHRYMRTDDDLAYYIGSKFMGAELKEAPPIKSDDWWGDEHEVQFLEIQTDKGVFTMASHNEHNGYYGGFCIVASPE